MIKLGAIQVTNAELTPFGLEMSILPTEPVYSKLLVTSLKDDYKDIRESISAIVALLSVENIFYQVRG